jgi:hypothetical protein
MLSALRYLDYRVDLQFNLFLSQVRKGSKEFARKSLMLTWEEIDGTLWSGPES